MARPRIINEPTRLNVLLEKSLKSQSRAFSKAQGFESHNDYLTRLMVGDLARKRSLACRHSRHLSAA